MKAIKIRIPTTTYIKKYLQIHYGPQIMINNHNPIGVMVIALLHKKSITAMTLALKDTRFIKFNDELICTAPWKLRYLAGIHLDDDGVIQLNRFFEASFEETLYQFVRFQITTPGRYPGYDEALNRFADRYGIELDDDISFDGLKKIEYRYRKKVEKYMPSFVPEDRYLSKQGILFEDR